MSDGIVTPTSDDTLATPPIRTPIASSDGNPLKQWYYYLRQGATLINAHTDAIGTLARALRYGTHADRLTTDPEPPGALWIESDRGNLIYEAQADANGIPHWVYVAGAMVGTIIATDKRPTDLTAYDNELLYISTDSTSVRWDGTALAWKAVFSLFDLGPAPQVSQVLLKANGLGDLSLLSYAPDSAHVGFDVELAAGAWKAANATCAWLSKAGGLLAIYGASGATVGAGVTQTVMLAVNLTNGNVGVGVSDPSTRFEAFGRTTLSANSETFALGLRYNRSSSPMYLGANSSGNFILSDAGGNTRVVVDQAGHIVFMNLPNVNPGAGSKQIWYDPADSNRVKYAP